MNPPESDSDERRPPPFRVLKRRIGRIRFIREDGAFGFIEAEDFREDVFFHRSTWEGPEGSVPTAETLIEFELDEEHLAVEKRLRAAVVRPTDRPEGKQLDARDDPHLMTRHHPKARRKRPTWRDQG